jgi:hypothetical protein
MSGTLSEFSEKELELISNLKFKRIETIGQTAMEDWNKLKSEGKGWPVIIGNNRDLLRFAREYGREFNSKVFANIIDEADTIQYAQILKDLFDVETAPILESLRNHLLLPDDQLPILKELDENDDLIALSPQEVRKSIQADLDKERPSVGEWPDSDVTEIDGKDIYSQLDATKQHILVIPVGDGAKAIAYLQWAGVNACPETKFHVAALKSWQDRYGAELVGLTTDSIYIHVNRRPETRSEALKVAREHFYYCPPEEATLSQMASAIMKSDWWFFWWD